MAIETLRLLVTDTQDWEALHFVKEYTFKGSERLGWSFHLSLCEEGTHTAGWEVTRSDICHTGLRNSSGNMILQGNLFADSMLSNLRDMPKDRIYQEVWEIMTADAASFKRSKIMTRNNTLIRD